MGCTSSRTLEIHSSKERFEDYYELGPLLGSGAYGNVRKCISKITGEHYAVKIIKFDTRDNEEWSNIHLFRSEVKILGILANSPNIIKLIQYFENKNLLFTVLELCEGGELFDYILKFKRLSEDVASYVCGQMLLAIQHCHDLNIVHRDIKTENFLLKSNNLKGEIRLIDFGMSIRLHSKKRYLSEICGSPHYLAPEVLGRNYGKKADIWACGVSTYLMLYGKYPFVGTNTDSIANNILTKTVNYSSSSLVISDIAINFLKQLLHPNAQKRFSAAQALAHPWICNVMNDV